MVAVIKADLRLAFLVAHHGAICITIGFEQIELIIVFFSTFLMTVDRKRCAINIDRDGAHIKSIEEQFVESYYRCSKYLTNFPCYSSSHGVYFVELLSKKVKTPILT